MAKLVNVSQQVFIEELIDSSTLQIRLPYIVDSSLQMKIRIVDNNMKSSDVTIKYVHQPN